MRRTDQKRGHKELREDLLLLAFAFVTVFCSISFLLWVILKFAEAGSAPVG